jgi:hypothetical protein
VVWAAYWSDPAAFRQWELAVADWWNSDERLQGPCGWFREVATLRAERFETLFSSPDRREGVAHLAGTWAPRPAERIGKPRADSLRAGLERYRRRGTPALPAADRAQAA